MDILSLIGILTALIAIIVGQVLEGGHISSLLQATAFMIVIGGTLGAVLLQSTRPQFLAGVRMARWIFQPPNSDYEAWIKVVVSWSNTARRGGLLALEGPMQAERDPFVKRGLQMLVDGGEPEAIRRMMEVEIDVYEDKHRAAAKIWEAAGGYAPTIGILGAVMGLIHVMENLSDPSKLGSGIAVAFVATIYGVGSANLLFLPIANKLKTLIAMEVKRREMLIEGIFAIASGENPRIVESKLRGFIS
ncbi:flagellar motor protein [Parachitinimonas caeni]|uniref:Flagellar motor protein n=1 Tax=Parachitinimonas caeni TaxID=3031301 RepID=A0ABT7DYD0_9NEIS|nr:flagellar motor protein [Parachitinimonas caeni]MDK2125060.1 flagellar motor protein [Parachitinimonas caeni]